MWLVGLWVLFGIGVMSLQGLGTILAGLGSLVLAGAYLWCGNALIKKCDISSKEHVWFIPPIGVLILGTLALGMLSLGSFSGDISKSSKSDEVAQNSTYDSTSNGEVR